MNREQKHKLDIPALDAQHKQIVSCLNELVLAMRQGCNSRDIENFLTRIEQYTVRHFGLEERYMAESEYPGLERQQQAHRYFISRLGQLTAGYRENGLSSSVVNGLRNELTEWITNHVTGLDLEFGEYFKRYQEEMARSRPGR